MPKAVFITPEVTVDALAVEKPFDELTYQDAQRLVADVQDELYMEARAFFAGDHWQDGDAWVGPIPDPTNPDAGSTADTIEHTLCPHPALDEIVIRHRDGVIGSEPRWSLAPVEAPPDGEDVPDATRRLIDETEHVMVDWWDDHDVLAQFQKACEDFALGGRAVFRIVVVPNEQDLPAEGGQTVTIQQGTLAEGLSRIWPMRVPAEQGVVFRDPVSKKELGVYIFEIVGAETGSPARFAEFTYLRNGVTVVRIVGENEEIAPLGVGEEAAVANETTVDLGHHLVMREVDGTRLITAPMLGNQKVLTKNNTMRGRNVDLGGFLERVILNGASPGRWEGEGAERVWMPDPYYVGAGSTNWIQGIIVGQDADGKNVLSNPSVVYRDPVSTVTFDNTEAQHYSQMLHGARQAHMLITGASAPSGETWKQARADFVKSLDGTGKRLNALGRWCLETCLKLAATFAGQPTAYDSLRVVFECAIDPGPVASDDRAATLAEVAASPPLRSVESGMEAIGIDDPDAEQERIDEERAHRAETAPPSLPTAQPGPQGLQPNMPQPALPGVQSPNAPAQPPAAPGPTGAQ